MPNYVSNRLTLSGEPVQLERFTDLNRSDERDGWPLDFGKLVPMPSDLVDEVTPKGTFPSWYSWRLENWGTKWNADSVSVSGNAMEGSVTYEFVTAWSPPDPWLACASEAFSEISFHHEFVEEMLHFAGKADWLAGEIVAQEAVDPEEIDWVELVELEEE